MPRTSPVHYIAPSAISITPNANGSANDLAVYVASGAKIKVYCPALGIGTTDATYQEWTLMGRNRRLNDPTGILEFTLYARLSKLDKNVGYLVFAAKQGGKDKYPYLTLNGLAQDTAGADTGNFWYIKLGSVSLPDGGQRSLELDTGILGTDQYNSEWTLSPDDFPLRVEVDCKIDGEDVGSYPYVYWGQNVVLKAKLLEGFNAVADISRFDHWEISRIIDDGNSGDDTEDESESWPDVARQSTFRTEGQISLSHDREGVDDFAGAEAVMFTVVAWGRANDESDNESELVPLALTTVTLHAETYGITTSDDIPDDLDDFTPSNDTIVTSAAMEAYMALLSGKYLRRDLPDESQNVEGDVEFEKDVEVDGELAGKGRTRLEGDVILGLPDDDGAAHDKVLRSSIYTAQFSGWQIDEYGNMEVESLKVRSYLETEELRINRLQAQEGDTIFTDNDQIEEMESYTFTHPDSGVSETRYILTFKEKWSGYFTAQQYGNILKGMINTLAANYVAERSGRNKVVDPESEEWNEQEQDDAVYEEGDGKVTGNKFFTSWMYVVADRNTDHTLGLNQIRVALYPSSTDYIPQGKNFPPCIDMVVGRWGCLNYGEDVLPADDAATKAEKERVLASIRKRQSFFYISSSEGRIMKLNSVSSPILREGNFGTVLGNVPDFVRSWASWDKMVEEHPGLLTRDYLYSQGLLYHDLIKVDLKGAPVPVTVNCGDWVDGSTATGTWVDDHGDTVNLPAPKKGIYYNTGWNAKSEQYETHTVRHKSGTWLCLISQPSVDNGVAVYHEPKWNSQYWRLIDGNENMSIELLSSNGTSFRMGAVNTVITPYLFFGNVDITADIAAEYWSWERELLNDETGEYIKTADDERWDLQHKGSYTGIKTLHLTSGDMPAGWSMRKKAVFTCKTVVDDGKSTVTIENQIIA